MGITRGIIDWIDKKFAEAIDEDDERKGMQKAALSGAVEGYLDAAVLMYPVVVLACYVYQSKLKK